MPSSARGRLVDAAFDLFEEKGFDQATIDDVTERAGVGRTTFFRYFPTKEDVVLADHESLLADVVEALHSGPGDLAHRVADSARVVVRFYVGEGERARRRYRLSARVPAIRSREVAGMRSYQRAFYEAVREELGGDAGGPAVSPAVSLDAGLVASSVITATHHVLRRWLRGETEEPQAEFDAAIARALSPWLPLDDAAPTLPPQALAVVRRTTPVLEDLLTALRVLEQG